MTRGEAYLEDLAYIHDRGYGGFARGAAPGLLGMLRDANIVEGTVIDFGCGSGIWAAELGSAGYDVVGVDISPAMLEIARQRAPRATFHQSSFREFQLPRCRAVTALGEVFNYLFDESHSERELAELCGRIYAALEPGGLLIFDVADTERHRSSKQMFTEGEDWACLVEYQHDDELKQLGRRIISFRKIGDLYRRSEEIHRQQLFSEQQILGMLAKQGFEARSMRSYGDYRLGAGVIGYAARKPQ